MKVKELIETLQKHDPDLEVQIAAEGCLWDIIDIDLQGKILVIESND